MRCITYFVVQPTLPGKMPITFLHTDEFIELFLSPHIGLTSYNGMACIESESLAHQYAEGCSVIMQKRYGDSTALQAISREEIGVNKLIDRINRDSAIIRMRIAIGNFVPDKNLLSAVTS
jgi:hypothetical protein